MTSPDTSDAGRDANPGALIFTLSLAVGALWVVGSLAAAAVLMGVERLTAASPVEMAAIAGAALLPACMAVFSGLAARDSARARSEARRLADAADRLLNPERSAEDAARRLAMTVRGEISTLDHALEHTLAKLQEVQGQIARQAQAVDEIAVQAKAGANQMITGMEREREELLRISTELNSQAQMISGSISKHTDKIAEAARIAEAEVRAADQALDHRLTSFGAAAALITDRTQHLTGAAQASADSALRLESALSSALDVLAKATNLTDAARQSAEAATLAANSTAGAVRDTTIRAIDDAKRAADLIRGEAASVEREAAVALERLREAANAAREAAIGARTAVEDSDRQPSRQRVRARAPQLREDSASPTPGYDRSWRDEEDSLESAPPPRARDQERMPEQPPRRDPQREAPTPGNWTWRDLLSNVDDGRGRQAQRRETDDPAGHQRRPPFEPRGPALPIIDVIQRSGVRLDEAFSPSALERIAQRARSGTQARRRAVRGAAPDASRKLGDYLARDTGANQEAMLFLRMDGARIAELMGRGRAVMNAEATRAFLLIDAAAG